MLRRVLGPAADSFDYRKIRILPRDFLLPNWQGRERDFLCEIPFRLSDDELCALVCILVEHQTRPSRLMPLRTLIYTVFYWEKQLRAWEGAPSPRAEFHLPPVVPIVLHASPKLWTGPRTLAELLDEPAAFHTFAPRWEPVFWELGKHSVDHSEEAFLQLLAIVRADDAERTEALRIYRESVQSLSVVRETSTARWTHLLRFALGWVLNRRPKADQADYVQVTADVQKDVLAKEEIRNMAQTMAQYLVEEGFKQGQEQGLKLGQEQGRVETLRSVVREIGRTRLGDPTPATQSALEAITDVGRLERLFRRVQTVSSWEELLKE